ncbi:hypothetical protein ElyMa_000537500 [Elysia marginata]|uniref:Uncharacterized protein n=1 Tax=Elysia marginata TaxID=1093978 RepID=A0AAV4G0Y0_9GAST|nr:hypothetical protein ElyMa_000537500 [Elysia marginata]
MEHFLQTSYGKSFPQICQNYYPLVRCSLSCRAEHFSRRFRDMCIHACFRHKKYMGYVRQRFRGTIVVFVGYRSGPSTKDIIQLRKTKGKLTTSLVFTSYHIRYDSANQEGLDPFEP